MLESSKANLAKIKSYCTYQERCHSEVRNKLLELGERGESLEEIIITLIQENYLNEQRFAFAYAHGKFSILKWGKIKIAQGLTQKGITGNIANKALNHLNASDYYDCMEKLLRSKWSSLQKERSIAIKKKKVLNYMLQKGYDYASIMPIVLDLEKSK